MFYVGTFHAGRTPMQWRGWVRRILLYALPHFPWRRAALKDALGM